MSLRPGVRLAVDRTRLAYERTLMATVRTAVSLITFGFSIYKFFELELRGRVDPAPHLIGPRGFAMLMIGIGLATLLAALVQNTFDMRRLRAGHAGAVPLSVARLVAGLIFVLGVLAALAVAFRL